MSDLYTVIKAESPEHAAVLLGNVRERDTAVVCCRIGKGDWRSGDCAGSLLAALNREGPVIVALEGEGVVAANIAEAADLVIAAREVVFAGARGALSAKDALRNGLITEVADGEQVRLQAEAVAESISRLAPNAVMSAKRAVREGMRLGLEEGLDIERRLFASLFETADMKEGTSAFLQKRRPEFKGF